LKITLLTYGSRGDVQPFLALAIGLRKAGHEVVLAAPSRFSSLITPYHIQFVPLAGDPAEISKGFTDAGTNVYRMVKSMRDYVLGIAPQVVDQIIEASSGADLLVHSFLFTTGAHSLARGMGIPDVSVQLFPMFAPTGDYPNVAFPPLGRLGNYCSHWFSTQVFWFGGNASFKEIQHLLPGSFPRTLHWPFSGAHPSPLLIACSPSVIPESRDWPAFVHTSGYLFMDTEAYQPPDALMQFLENGQAPICVDFGSTVNREANRIQELVIETLSRRHERVILLAGWSGNAAQAFSENTLYLQSAPHDWLFPRCKAVIHHGGAGTTAAGLRAGIASIILPHSADQPFWGRRVRDLGVGAAPISIRQLSGERLTAALDEIENPDLISRARNLGRKIALEDGVGTAIRWIEQAKSSFSLKNQNL